MCNFVSNNINKFLLVSLITALTGCGNSSNEEVVDPPKVEYSVSVTSSDGGSVSETQVMVEEGDSTAFKLTADEGYSVSEAVGCDGSLENNVFNTGAITQDCVVTISFMLDNRAPSAQPDSVTISNDQVTTIEVLLNDTDLDGDSLTISEVSIAPSNGTAEISQNSIIYTPQTGYIGTDTFTYVISDGEYTDTAQVSITMEQSLTIEGQVIDAPIAGALVNLSVGTQSFNTTADNQGFYSLNVTVEDLNAMMVISAQGIEANGQQYVTLKSYLGTGAFLVQNSDAQRIVTSSDVPRLNITHVSTAESFLLRDKGLSLTNNAELQAAKAELNFEEVLEIAAFIKLLVDHPDYTLEDGQTIESLLTQDDESVQALVNDYLISLGFSNNAFNYSNKYEADLATAKEQSIALLTGPLALVPEMFAGGQVVESKITQPGYSAQFPKLIDYVSASAGTVNQHRFDTLTMDWSVVSGSLAHQFPQLVENSYAITQNSLYGFEPSVGAYIYQLYQQNPDKFPTGYIDYVCANKDVYKPISVSENYFQAQKRTESTCTLALPEGLSWQGDTPYQTESETSFVEMTVASQQQVSLTDAENLHGTWALPVRYAPDYDSTYGNVGVDIFTFSPDGTAMGKYTQSTYNWSISSGTLQLSNDSETLLYTPYKRKSVTLETVVSVSKDGKLVERFAGSMAKFESDSASLVEQLQLEYPLMLNYTNANRYAAGWKGHRPLHFSGLYLAADYTGFADVTSSGDSLSPLTWSSINNQIDLVIPVYYDPDTIALKQLTVINQISDDAVFVVEYWQQWRDYNVDGVITDDELLIYRHPTITRLKIMDVSELSSDWQDSILYSGN
ncbi:Ig-like domain-containing protein [Aliiglaciecola sp. LCG003]|uniref:Ig-like domain-containing protein n=1 Tax=Aliiglaciecola sp. LCG003 TaxID=3053655 RepID=UPI0025742AFC|nr:Ig-like domain-containing protein [Aliiglaciecola sp. LCG003]WJG09950.1 Ig-like domain-containing protein [Aliiglaciecola sp. LCG003]